MNKSELVKVIAVYDYTAQAEDELTLHINDIVTDVVMQDGGWWSGSLYGKRGYFPDNFVRDLKVSSKSSPSLQPETSRRKDVVQKPFQAVAVYSYSAAQPDELSLSVGDVINVLSQEQDGWWKGTVNGEIGVFPSNFVKVTSLDTDKSVVADNNTAVAGSPAAVGVELNNRSGEQYLEQQSSKPGSFMKRDRKPRSDRAVVVYSYAAENKDELSLCVGDVINVLEKNSEDHGWWKGEIRGKIGVFPDNFVQLLPNATGNMNTNGDTSNVAVSDKNFSKRNVGKSVSSPVAVSASQLSCFSSATDVDDEHLITQTDDHKAITYHGTGGGSSRKSSDSIGAGQTRFVQKFSAGEKSNRTSPAGDLKPGTNGAKPAKPAPAAKRISLVITPENSDQPPPVPLKSPGLRKASLSIESSNTQQVGSAGKVSQQSNPSPPRPRRGARIQRSSPRRDDLNQPVHRRSPQSPDYTGEYTEQTVPPTVNTTGRSSRLAASGHSSVSSSQSWNSTKDAAKENFSSNADGPSLVVNSGDSTIAYDVAAKLFLELRKLNDSLQQLQQHCDKKSRQLENEIEEERYARQILQQEVMQLKKVFLSRHQDNFG